MKQLVVLVLASFISTGIFAQEDPVIMTIDGKEITKSEFLQIYLKNNPEPKYDQASLDEYVELFKKFKLKVAEAETLGYDTIPKLVKELEGYRKQLALPYLVDSAMNEALVKEAYERTKMEVRASHILLKSPPKGTPEDTLKLYNRLLELKKRIEAGEDFAAVAKGKQGSEDPSVASNGGDLGYFTAFQMVYPFEDMAYKTKIGEISEPFATRFGYHIVKVTSMRPARGSMQAAHIMVQVGQNDPDDKIQAAEAKINEIYDLLQKGEDFESLVRKYSDDPSSNNKGGVLPTFGTGSSTRMVPEFEEAAFELKTDGDYSKPVRTDYGFHIIKRISWTDIPTFEQMKKELESKVAKDVRSKQTQDSFVAKLKKEYGFKKKNDKPIVWFETQLDTTYFQGKFQASSITSAKTIFTLNKAKFTQQDFAKFLESSYRTVRRDTPINEVVSQLYAQYEKQAILDYEETQLPVKYPAYKALITEYHDGILLYEIMSDMVWNKAMKDTVGLKAYFLDNQDKYWWGKRLDADVFECYSMEAAEATYKLLQNDTTSVSTVIKTINKDSELNTRHRTGKYDVEKTNFFAGTDLKQGLNAPYELEGKYFVVRVNEVLAPATKEFSEAKGSVTSDYQNYLEEQWLKELHTKYKVEVNKEALYSLGK